MCTLPKGAINPLLYICFILLAGNFYMGYIIANHNNHGCLSKSHFINPNLNCGEKPTISKAGYVEFRSRLNYEINRMKQEGRVEEIGIYFRDLKDGPTLGINDRQGFIPASLLKLPVMLTYFKLAETDPEIIKKAISYSSSSPAPDYPQTILPEQRLELDKPYTIDELIFRMVAYSDNRAYNLLFDYLKILSPEINLLDETYKELGIIDPKDDVESAVLSAKYYSSIFRLLYNSSYLSNELSEKGLKYLSYSTYIGGLRRGVPSDVLIAHKFGERDLDNGIKELHDCGIIYYPGNPYTLCIMTKGDDFDELSSVIGEVSRRVYEEVNSRRILN